MLRYPLLALCLLLTPAAQAELEVVNVAGNGQPGFWGDGGLAVDAKINNPFGVVIGPDGNLYICDTGNHCVRMVDSETGIISTVAGKGEQKGYSGDGGPAVEALCFEPYEVRFDAEGNLFFVEMRNHLIRRVDKITGIISTVAGTGESGFSGDGGPATEATFNRPHSIQFDADGDLYIADIGNHRIRTVDMKTGVVDTFCGTGKSAGPEDGARISAETSLKGPRAIDFDAEGHLWLALREGNAVFRFDLEENRIEHIAGTGKKGFTGHGGPATEATLSGPKGITIGPDGQVHLADTESHSVRTIDLSQNPPTLELTVGTGEKGNGPVGAPLQCKMARLHGVFAHPESGDLYIGDSEAHVVRLLRKKP